MKFDLIVVFVSIVILLKAVTMFLGSNKKFNLMSVIRLIGALLFICGAIGFMGILFSSGGKLTLPETVEWPIGKTDNVLKTEDNIYIVPHQSADRIQIYNSELEFIRGWNIDTGGGMYKLVPIDNNQFTIYTVRGDIKYIYDIEGNLISEEEPYQTDYSKLPSEGMTVEIPTPFYLIFLTNPAMAWTTALIGLALTMVMKKSKKEKREMI